MVKLLMVCSGNICRSPIAEIMAPHLANEMGISVIAKSAGTLGLMHKPAASHSIAVCKEIKLDLRKHQSQALSQELIDWATYILVMERKHAIYLRSNFEGTLDKTLELGSFCGLPQIKDPIGGWKYQFRRCRNDIEKALRNFLQQLPRS